MAPRIPFIAAALVCATCLHAEPIGSVSTVFKLIGANDKIVVEVYDDPKVKGVACYVSRAKTAGVKGSLGLAEDKSEASIACRQVGPISFDKPLPEQEEVFSERIRVWLIARLVASPYVRVLPAVMPRVFSWTLSNTTTTSYSA